MEQKGNSPEEMKESNDKSHGTNVLTVKDWAQEDQPREKLITRGKKELSDAELIAILLRSGAVGLSAVELAKKVLNSCGNDLTLLSKRGVKELTQNKELKGLGETKAVTIIAALELGYRMLNESNNRKEYFITDSMALFRYISPSLIDLPHEEFWAVYMNIKKKVLHKQQISIGGFTETAVDIRRIFTTALEKNAVFIAVAHNHPSGDLKPSSKDKELTKKIAAAGNILNITLTDHIVVGIDRNNKPDYFSFFDEGILI